MYWLAEEHVVTRDSQENNPVFLKSSGWVFANECSQQLYAVVEYWQISVHSNFKERKYGKQWELTIFI